jgi:hypothetical protein
MIAWRFRLSYSLTWKQQELGFHYPYGLHSKTSQQKLLSWWELYWNLIYSLWVVRWGVMMSCHLIDAIGWLNMSIGIGSSFSVHPLSIVLDSVTAWTTCSYGSFATFRLWLYFSGAGMIWYKRSPRKKHLCSLFVSLSQTVASFKRFNAMLFNSSTRHYLDFQYIHPLTSSSQKLMLCIHIGTVSNMIAYLVCIHSLACQTCCEILYFKKLVH